MLKSFLFFSCLAIFCWSCKSNSINGNIWGKWSVQNVQLVFPKSSTNLSQTLINNELENTKSKVSFHFFPNNQYELLIGNSKEQGHYTFSPDNNEIILQKQNNPHKHRLKLHKFSATMLEMTYQSTNGSSSRWILLKQS